MLELMLWPLLGCLVLTGILVYLGIHIVEREVIFVDLALAQIAALGTLIAFLFGLDLHSTAAYGVSFLFAIVGATIFTLTRLKEKRVTQEAFIGIVYAFAAAGSILVLHYAPSEAEHIKHMLVGNILFVKVSEIIMVAVIAVLVGLFHYIYRGRFLLISTDVKAAQRANIPIKWWDFLFYASFGLMITSSVAVAGVLLVFSYLIVPAVCAMLLLTSIKSRLLLGWGVGVAASMIGLYLSVALDFPTGAAIVCTLSLIVPVVGLLNWMVGRRQMASPISPEVGAE
ncbi:MAG: metal ABC transporter permease [Fidelibacterota bacterium]|nr:MAG: metal ABC transporter permease [Candidatus Neomarinimicrobiota bacterium]